MLTSVRCVCAVRVCNCRYRHASRNMQLPEAEALLRVPSALDEASCRRLREIVDEYGGMQLPRTKRLNPLDEP